MFVRAIIAFCVISLTSACGFHLRGSLPLSETLMLVAVTSNDAEAAKAMAKVLESSGATVVGDESSARSVLDMYDVKFRRKVRTIDTRGKVTGYTLVYRVNYRVIGEEGDQLKRSGLSITRDYNFDPNQVLQAEAEEESLKEDMLEELARRILWQLSTVAAREPVKSPLFALNPVPSPLA